jgi:hypothetical protein
LQELGVDENQRGLQEVQGEHGHFGVLAVSAGDGSFPPVENLVVGAVRVLDDLQTAGDLAAQGLVGEVVAREDGADHAAEFLQGEVDRLLKGRSHMPPAGSRG